MIAIQFPPRHAGVLLLLIVSSAILAMPLSVSATVTLWHPHCMPDPSATAPYVPPPSDPLKFPTDVTLTPPFATCDWVPAFPYTPATQCPPDNTFVITPFVPLFAHPVLLATTGLAEYVIESQVTNGSAYINSIQNLLQLHMSLNYFGCYNETEGLIIYEVLRNLRWNSFSVNFNNMSCDVDSQQAYLTIEADPVAQDTLMSMARQIEDGVSAAGVMVKQPRVERFHATLANVAYGYPSDCMVEKLQKYLLPYLSGRSFGQVQVCCFELQAADGSTTAFFAQDCLNTGICINY